MVLKYFPKNCVLKVASITVNRYTNVLCIKKLILFNSKALAYVDK